MDGVVGGEIKSRGEAGSASDMNLSLYESNEVRITSDEPIVDENRRAFDRRYATNRVLQVVSM